MNQIADKNSFSFRLGELANILGAEVKGDANLVITGLATLKNAGPQDLSFLANMKYKQQLEATRAGAVIIHPDFATITPCAALLLDNPYAGYAQISHHFDPRPTPELGISPSAHIASTAILGDCVSIGHNVVVEDHAVIGSNTIVESNTYIGARSRIGENSRIAPNVSIYHDVSMGSHSMVHSGAVIGADGFGFAFDRGQWIKISQIGGVSIGDHVEIGACTTIDRGALDDTVIEDGVILDNQIQVGHNVRIGAFTCIAGCTAIAGSTTIGKYCRIGGAVGIVGHLDIADKVVITAMTLITRSIKESGMFSSGTGFETNKHWKKNVVRFRQLDDMAKRLRALEHLTAEQQRSEKG